MSFFFISFMAMFLGNLIGIGITTLMGAITNTDPISGIETYAMSSSNLLKIVFLVILAPTIEECIFRKMLIDRMHPYGAWPAILTSAAMFGLFHGNFSQMFYAFFVGICFGFIYMRTGKIQYSACMHITINFLGSVIAPALLSNLNLEAETTVELASQGGAFIGYLVYLLFMVGSTILGIFLLIANRRNLSFEPQSKQIARKGSFTSIWCNWGMLLFLLGCLGMVVLTFR